MAHNENLFIDDVTRPGMLHIIPVLSDIPRGSIKNVVLPEMPSEFGFLGPGEIPGKKYMELSGDTLPFFVEDEILYEGQTIGLLYGPDEKELRELKRHTRIEYETDFSILSFNHYKPDQIIKEKHVIRGKKPKNTKELTKETQEYQVPLGIKGPGTVSGGFAVKEKGKLIVRGASHWPFYIRSTIADGLSMEQNTIIFQGTGGTRGEDGPIWFPAMLMFHAALTAGITGKPCRLLVRAGDTPLDKGERAPVNITITSGYDQEGNILERKINLEVDAGIIPVLSDELLDRLCLSVMGIYPGGYIEINIRLIKTSNPPIDNFNGLGMAQGFWAAEIHDNIIAGILGQDPLERKKNNCLGPGKPFLTGGIYNRKTDPGILIEKIGVLADFRRKYASYQLRNNIPGGTFPVNPKRGIGISAAYQGNGFLSIPPGKFSVSVRLDNDEKVSVRTSSVPAFPRTREIWKEIASGILQVDNEHIDITSLDTSKVPDSGPALFSNNVTVIPRLIEQCCQAIQKKRFRAPLPIEIKRTFRLPANRTWDRESFQGQPFISLSWASAVVEVEMDPVGMIPEINNVWMVVDCGRIIDPEYARSVVESSIYRAFNCFNRNDGTTGRDEIPGAGNWYRGNPLPVRIEFIESMEKQPGGLGNLAENTIPAAFISAVNQASGTRITSLPFYPENLLSGTRKEK